MSPLAIRPGETLGLVGEVRLRQVHARPTVATVAARRFGSLRFAGELVSDMPGLGFDDAPRLCFKIRTRRSTRARRWRRFSRRPLSRFGLAHGARAAKEMDRLLDLVRLPRSFRARYPHQLSGGESSA